jgi:tryptophan halogenase
MKIVIVGGGTAGWLAASLLCQSNVSHKKDSTGYRYDITVIESDAIPTIGAGEGSTGVLVDTITKKLTALGVTERDFIVDSEATLKMGIRFKDWNGVGTEYISPVQPSDSWSTGAFFDLPAHAYKAFGDVHDSNLTGYLMAREYSSCKTNGKTLQPLHAYHFDAHKVGAYLRKICEKHGVDRIEGDIINLTKDFQNGNLKSVTLKTGEIIEADYWIDCSGMSKVLIKPMGGEWISYEKYLPVNSAMPYIHKYDKDENVLAETLAWAMPNGWMWQIPTQQRYGCGYVYCDSFTTQDNALVELEKTTGRKIEPLRNIKFDVGRVKNFWVKNVVAAGLSSGFLEPLQATSIHSTVIQLELFIHHFLHPQLHMETNLSSDYYNSFVGRMFDEFKDLIQIHYMTKRNDSEFWKYVNSSLEKTDKTKFVLEVCKYRGLSSLDFEHYMGCAGWGVWGWTLFGLDIITKETALETIKKYGLIGDSHLLIESMNRFNKIKQISLLKNKDFHKILTNRKF